MVAVDAAARGVAVVVIQTPTISGTTKCRGARLLEASFGFCMMSDACVTRVMTAIWFFFSHANKRQSNEDKLCQ